MTICHKTLNRMKRHPEYFSDFRIRTIHYWNYNLI